MAKRALPIDETLLQPSAPPLDQNPAAIYLASLTSDKSRRTMSNALRTVTGLLIGCDVEEVSHASMLSLDWPKIRYEHTYEIRAQLMRKHRPATVNRILSALRGTIKEAWRMGLMSAEDYQRAVDIQNVKPTPLPSGRELAAKEIQALVETCKQDDSPSGKRDAAIIGLLYTCGLRRSELVALRVDDVDLQLGEIIIRNARDDRERVVYIAGGALRALADWMDYLGKHKGPVFVPILKSGEVRVGSPMVSQSVYDMLKKRARQAGVREFSPHDLRRTFVGDMLDQGVDIATVANIAGHSSVETTRRYDRRAEAPKKRAASKLNYPY